MNKIWFICIFNMATKMDTVHSFYCMGLKVSDVSLLEISLTLLKFGLFAYSIWLPKLPNYAPNSIFSCLQSTILFVWDSNFHMYTCFRSPTNCKHFAHLHIQYDCQNSKFMIRTAHYSLYSTHILL